MISIQKLVEYGFYLFVLILPWQTRLIWRDVFLNGFVWEYGRLSLYAAEIFLVVLLLLYGFWLVKNKPLKNLNFNKREILLRLKQPSVLLYWLVVSLAAVAGILVVWALDVQLAYISWIHLVEIIALFSAIVVFNFKLEKIAVAWVASSVIQSLFAIWQFFVQYTPANKWLGLAYHLPTIGGSIILETTSERWLRAYGSFPHPNILAGFLLIGLLFILYLSFKVKKSQSQFLLALSLAFVVPALFFTFSRSAWIAFLAVLALLGFWLYKNNHKAWRKTFFEMTLLILLLVSIFGVTLSEPLVTRILGVQPLEVNSIELRFTFTEQALQLMQNNFWLGTGLGNYTLGVFEQIDSSWPGYYYQPVHNIYLLIFVELGIFGFAIFSSMMITWLVALKIGEPSLEKTIVALMFLAILIISLFDHYFWTLYAGALMFWIVLAFNLKELKQS